MKNCCQFVFYKNIARFLLLFLLEFLDKKEKNKLRHHHVISHKPKLSINQRMRNRSVIVKKESRVFHYTYTVLQFFFILMRKARAVRTDSYSVRTLYKRYWTATGRKRQGEGTGGGGANCLSYLTVVWDWKSYIDRIVYHFLTGLFF